MPIRTENAQAQNKSFAIPPYRSGSASKCCNGDTLIAENPFAEKTMPA